jgi:hypothetical protein
MSWVLVIDGYVQVWQEVDGKIRDLKTYRARGVSRKGNSQEAVNNMRAQAKLLWFRDNQINKTGGTVKARVESYDVNKDTTRDVIRKRYLSKGKYYFYVRDKNTGRFITRGKWTNKPIEETVDSDIDMSNDYEPTKIN